MSDNNRYDGGAAFPSDRFGEPGMSLRDWFAGQALAGIASAQANGSIAADLARNTLMLDASVSAMAYFLADAMLAKRAKERE